ncbi:MAG: hypothetical protein VB051_02505 [Candidatus Pelethousia sp.]|nr:hypothetical protein [Candidatus Pelethousia sp.]
MKKFFAAVFSVIMTLTVASGALAAFTWNAAPGATPESFAARYKIEVVKLANESGAIGSTKLIEAPAANAANHASVYFYIRLTVAGAADDIAAADDIQKNARADVSFTALRDFFTDIDELPCVTGIDLSDLDNGVYYFNVTGQAEDGGTPATWFLPITGALANSSYSRAAIECRCLDSATAKAYAKVYSKRPFSGKLPNGGSGPVPFACGGYWIWVAEDGLIGFADHDYKNVLVFTRNKSTGQITQATVGAHNTDANFVVGLYTYLGFAGSDVEAGSIYMTDDNLRAAFGFDYQGESFVTWDASPVAIILDPAIGIPKTGGSADILGPALLLLSVSAALCGLCEGRSYAEGGPARAAGSGAKRIW